MFSEAATAIKEALAAYQRVTPLTQKISRALALGAGGLFCIILPDILAAFGVTVATWKDYVFSWYGAALFGTGISQLLFPMFFNHTAKNNEGEREQPAPHQRIENAEE